MSSPELNDLPLILEPSELEPLLGHPRLVLVDLCRPDQYVSAHLPGAIHVSPAETQWGQPPAPGLLPSLTQLQHLVERLGLGDDSWAVRSEERRVGKECGCRGARAERRDGKGGEAAEAAPEPG